MTVKSLLRLNALVSPGSIHQFSPFLHDFCLTDVVLNLWSFPAALESQARCGIWLVTPGASEILFELWIDEYGHQIHLNSGIYCPNGSYLTANTGVFAAGPSADLRVLMTGRYQL